MAPVERIGPRYGLWFWITLAAVIALGIFLRCRHMTDVLSRSPDERIYNYYAATLVDDGLPGYRELLRVHNATPEMWFRPAPSRCGFVFLSAIVMDAAGVRTPRAGAAVSWLFSILSLALLAWLGIRFLSPWTTLLAVAFLACSFSELSMARRGWQDSLFGFLGLLLVYVTCEIARAPRRKSLYFALSAVAAYSMLVKETAYVSYGICGLWLAGALLLRERSWKLFGVLLLSGAASVAVTFGVWTILSDSPAPALQAIWHLVHAHQASTYTAQNYSGPWYQFLYLLFITGPVTALMALAGAVLACLPHPYPVRERLEIRDWTSVRIAALMTATFVGLSCFGPYLQCLRIISPADGTYSLLAGLGLSYLLSLARPIVRRESVIVCAAVFVLAAETAVNYYQFTHVVVQSGMEDLAVWGIRFVMKL